MSASDNPSLSPDQAIEEAFRIADILQRQRIQSSTNSVNWNSFCVDRAKGRPVVQPMGFTLYDGICGPALFLAALEQVTGKSHYHDLLIVIAKQVSAQLGPGAVESFGLGAGSGVPSAIYALTRISACVDDPWFLEQAEALARLVSKKAIREDRTYDLLDGAGGCILALLALSRQKQDAGFLIELALECGEHLLNSRTPGTAGLLSWRIMGGRMNTGFAHGAAGIAYALDRLYDACGDERFRSAALEACAFENTLYVERTGNWLDSPDDDDRPAAQFFQWCHGAPGIGLARLGMLHLDSKVARKDGLWAATQTAIASPAGVDHACCGNTGRIELLFVAGKLAEFYEIRARELAAFIVRRARKEGSYAYGLGSDQDHLGFHQGIAGIGFQCLRLAAPSSISSALLWQ